MTNQPRPNLAAEDWCIACGASSGLAELPMALSEHFRAAPESLRMITNPDFVKNLTDKLGQAAWCIACGASKSSAFEDVINPARISDAEIEALAKRLMPFMKG